MALPRLGQAVLRQQLRELRKRQVIRRCIATTANPKLPEHLRPQRHPPSEQLRVQVVYLRQNPPHRAQVLQSQPSHPGQQARAYQVHQPLVPHVRLRLQPERLAEAHDRPQSQHHQLPHEAQQKLPKQQKSEWR